MNVVYPAKLRLYDPLWDYVHLGALTNAQKKK